VTDPNDAKDRMLRGALAALARYGSRRFSMSLVAEEAGVSRATLYRYFPTKEELLDGLTGHIGRDFRRFLDEELRNASPDENVIAVVVEVMRRYTVDTPVLTQILAAEPLFVRSFYSESFHNLVRDVATAIGPGFGVQGKSAAKRADVLTAAELLVRTAMSYRIVGVDTGPQRPGTFSVQLAELIERSVQGK
jgi:AcrR family transcriptional regulator